MPLGVGVGVTGADGLGAADEGAVEGVPVGDALGDALDEAVGVAVRPLCAAPRCPGMRHLFIPYTAARALPGGDHGCSPPWPGRRPPAVAEAARDGPRRITPGFLPFAVIPGMVLATARRTPAGGRGY